MKSVEGSYLLAEVKWALSYEIGVIHPYLHMSAKGVYYDLFSKKVFNDTSSVEEEFSRHYNNVAFVSLDTEILYCTKMRSAETMGNGFSYLPTFDGEKMSELTFYGDVCRLCKDLYVSDEDLILFAKTLRNLMGLKEERFNFVALQTDPVFINYRKKF